MASTPRDDNHVVALVGEDSTDPTKTVVVKVNPNTGGVLVQLV